MTPILISKGKLEEVLDSVNFILNKNKLLTLSTVDKKNNSPCSSTAFFCFDENFNIYIWTSEDTTHGRNIEENNKVAVNIFDSSQKWGTGLQGLQIKGRASKTSGNELLVGGALYLKRFLDAKSLIKNIQDFNSKKLESKLYKISIDFIKIFDENKFGKEKYHYLKIDR